MYSNFQQAPRTTRYVETDRGVYRAYSSAAQAPVQRRTVSPIRTSPRVHLGRVDSSSYATYQVEPVEAAPSSAFTEFSTLYASAYMPSQTDMAYSQASERAHRSEARASLRFSAADHDGFIASFFREAFNYLRRMGIISWANRKASTTRKLRQYRY